MLPEEARHRDAVSEVTSEGLHAIVYDHRRLQRARESAQVFNVDALDFGAVLTVEAVAEELVVRVE